MTAACLNQPLHQTSSEFNNCTIIDQLNGETEYLVWHQPSDKYAALIIPPQPEEPDDAYFEGFIVAMQAAARLYHPAITPILDFGIYNNVPYVITPYYPGGSLLQHLHIRGPFSLAEVVKYLGPIAQALDEAHNQSIAHYLLTPSAIYRADIGRNEYVLSNFGIGQLTFDMGLIPASFMPYAAPEIYLRMPCAPIVDVYALGIIVYQLLTGELPYGGFSYAQQMNGHVNTPLPSIRHLRPDLPAAVQDVLNDGMAKLPHSRYASAVQFFEDLARAGELAANGEIIEQAHLSTGRTLGGKPFYSQRGERPGKLQKQRLKAGYVSLSRQFVDALMLENHDPVRAATLYREIVQTEPQYSNGATVERLARLERELGTQQIVDLLTEAQSALETKNWSEAEKLAELLLSIDPLHPLARRIHHMGVSGEAARKHYHLAQLAMAIGDQASAVQLLEELTRHSPTHDDPEGLRLLTRDVAVFVREAHHLQTSQSSLLTLTFSPDNQYLITGGTDKHMRIWKMPNLTLIKEIEHPAWVCGTVFSPDGRLLLSATWDGEIKLWSMPHLNPAGLIAGMVNQVQAMAFSCHDHTLLATASALWLALWSVPSGKRITTFHEPDRVPVTALAFSPTAPVLIYGLANGDVRLREVSQPKAPLLMMKITAHHAPVYDVAISPDGSLLASAARDGSVKLVDAATGAIVDELRGHRDAVHGVRFSPEGSLLATCGRDRTIRLWDSQTGKQIKILEGHLHGVRTLSFSPDGRMLASADSGGAIRLWQL
jgi:hypothetical protein